MRRPHDIIIRPVISEHSIELMDENKYTFIVDKKSNKSEIKKAIEEIFKVSVIRISTLKVRGKKRRMGRFEGKTPEKKKAIVTLKSGDKIEVFEGL